MIRIGHLEPFFLYKLGEQPKKSENVKMIFLVLFTIALADLRFTCEQALAICYEDGLYIPPQLICNNDGCLNQDLSICNHIKLFR